MQERPAAEVVTLCDENGVDLLQETLTYRLPWAMEAVRVHAAAVGHEGSDDLHGLVALAVEAGSPNRSVIVLLRSGLTSREAAIAAVSTTGATFNDRAGMLVWLDSDVVNVKSAEDDWPTPHSRHAWLQFRDDGLKGDRRKWKREIKLIGVEWLGTAPAAGTQVIVEPNDRTTRGFVMSPGFVKLGTLKSPLGRRRRDVVGARVADDQRTISVEFFGPPLPI